MAFKPGQKIRSIRTGDIHTVVAHKNTSQVMVADLRVGWIHPSNCAAVAS